MRTGPAAGLRFAGGDTAGYVLGMSEPTVQAALVEHLCEGDIFFDVGAHAGFMSLLGRRLVGPAGEVHSFEPVPGNCAVLKRNIEANDFRNVTVHEAALTDFDGTVAMATGEREITAAISDGGSLTVRAARCDSLALRPPSVVKIDVEGAEAAVLRGMRRTLREHHPVLIVEIHEGQDAIVRDLVAEFGYRLTVLDDGGMPHLIAT